MRHIVKRAKADAARFQVFANFRVAEYVDLIDAFQTVRSLEAIAVTGVTTEFGYTFWQRIEDAGEIFSSESVREAFAFGALAVEVTAVTDPVSALT